MKKIRNNLGFTLAELLVVVAIITALACIGVVGIGAARRALHHREMDSYAKEVFVAAQNHLSMAKSEGELSELDESARGSQIDAEKTQDIYYFVVGVEGSYPGQTDSVRALDLMLPFGSIDDNVRMVGSYIIRYQFVTARVLDVFYTEDAVLSSGDYAELMKDTSRSMEPDGKNARKHYDFNGTKADVGWFGGALASTLPTAKRLVEPTIEVVNGAKLLVNVENPNTVAETGYELKLIITGLTSHNQCVVDVIPASGSAPAWVKKTDSSRFTVTLDDVTEANRHFDQIANAAYTNAADAGKRLIPGEDITVQAVADYSGRLGNVARSSGVTTNSLFAAGSRSVSVPMTLPASNPAQQEAAVISNFRHLENLSYDISHFAPGGSAVFAVQNADLDWAEFRSDINGLNGKSGAALADSVTVNAMDAATGSAGVYRPVTLAGKDGAKPALRYYGMDRDALSSEPRIIRGLGDSIEMVKHITPGAPAGVFGELYSGSTLMDVAALGFRIRSAGPAGGLVGRMDGGALAYCAAASIVRATGSSAPPAGGLVGQTVSAQVTVYGCQTGGHTRSGTGGSISYYDAGANAQNVVAHSGSAGGLVGEADSTLHIAGSYSTCSASGSYAGGLVGSGSGSINSCYATGLVKGTHRGALAGSTGFSLTGNAYFSSINNGKDTTVLADHVKSGETDTDQDAKAKAFDKSLNDYRSLLSQIVNTSCTFNNKLPEHYDFKTVGELTGSSRTGSNIHYGDWPIPDNLLVNTRIGG